MDAHEHADIADVQDHPGQKKFSGFYHAALLVAIAFSVVLNLYFVYVGILVPNNFFLAKNDGFSYLDPAVSVMGIDEFLNAKAEYTASYTPLKTRIKEIIGKSNGTFGVYFEDLKYHSWFGINEREEFRPASMLKITSVATILHEVENGDISLDEEVVINSDDVNSRFGDLYKEEGETFTIKQLVEISLLKSDNTAIKKLHEYMTYGDWSEARLAMGLPLVSIEQSISGTPLTPKEFSSVFRSLYYSGYLSRTFSNWILMLLSETDFNTGIPAGVPETVTVSHKIGEWWEEGNVDDCGIVYAKKPYILCIMSENTNTEEGNSIISEISAVVYNYVSK